MQKAIKLQTFPHRVCSNVAIAPNFFHMQSPVKKILNKASDGPYTPLQVKGVAVVSLCPSVLLCSGGRAVELPLAQVPHP